MLAEAEGMAASERELTATGGNPSWLRAKRMRSGSTNAKQPKRSERDTDSTTHSAISSERNCFILPKRLLVIQNSHGNYRFVAAVSRLFTLDEIETQLAHIESERKKKEG